MDGSDNPNGAASAGELVEVIREIRERVRARHPSGSASGLPLPDLVPIVHARDAASAKVASIGTVNPRPPGVLNSAIQALKKLIARALDWHVREQVEFNRAAMTSFEAILEALNENNRALARLAAGQAELLKEIDRLAHLGQETSRRIDKLEADQAEFAAGVAPLREEARELKDVRVHWAQWRQEWEHKVSVNEVQFLRGIADLQAAFAHRATLMENNFREMVRGQHEDYLGALDRSTVDIQKRLWTDLEKVRAEFERLIFTELRLIRQRLALPVMEPAAATLTPPVSTPALDYARFAERFRGSPEFIREKQKLYLPYFQGRREVLDLGCGRGEFLELMQEAGVEARGIDASEESAAFCRQKGLRAEAADLFEYLQSVPAHTLDGIFCSQVVEHLAPGRIPEMIRLCASRLVRGGLLAVETPNPNCLAIFATYFFLDPTHTRPVPPDLLRFYMEEAGLGDFETRELSPAVESMSALASVPDDFRSAFFGGLDYALLARKLT